MDNNVCQEEKNRLKIEEALLRIEAEERAGNVKYISLEEAAIRLRKVVADAKEGALSERHGETV